MLPSRVGPGKCPYRPGLAEHAGRERLAQLFDLIKNGKGQMTPEGDRMKTDDIWNLVTYIRAMSKGH